MTYFARLILYKSFKILDHGFVRVIDYMGDDASIVQAARVSYGKGTKKLNQDKSLINYLLSHKHSTPFEMNEIKFHIKLPIFVARQWIRHRTANVNEYSARYSILDEEFYIPKIDDVKPQSQQNNQGRSGEIDKNLGKHYLSLMRENAKINFSSYHHLLNLDEDGEIDVLKLEDNGWSLNIDDREEEFDESEITQISISVNDKQFVFIIW